MTSRRSPRFRQAAVTHGLSASLRLTHCRPAAPAPWNHSQSRSWPHRQRFLSLALRSTPEVLAGRLAGTPASQGARVHNSGGSDT